MYFKLYELNLSSSKKTFDSLRILQDTSDKNDVEGDLEMENLIGAFIVLMVGLFFCLIITAAEFLNEVRNIVVREQVSFSLFSKILNLYLLASLYPNFLSNKLLLSLL